MESALYSIYALVVFVSEIERVNRRSEGVRFLVQKQVPKYHTPALSMKYFFIYHTENVYFDCNSIESANVLGTNVG